MQSQAGEPTSGSDVRARLGRAAAAFGSNARNPSLRRAQLSFLGAWTAEWPFTVGLAIVAYRDGGVTAVGLVGLLRMAPAAVLAPLLWPLGSTDQCDLLRAAMSAPWRRCGPSTCFSTPSVPRLAIARSSRRSRRPH